MKSDENRNRDARRALEDGLRRVASELGPEARAHVPHLRLRLAQGADATAVADAVRTALGSSATRDGGGAQGVQPAGKGEP